jgi:hypothetical protein
MYDTTMGVSGSDAPGTAGGGEPVPNVFSRIVQVFVSPGALFERLKNNPVWMDVMLLMIVVGLAGYFMIVESPLMVTIQEQAAARAGTDVPMEQLAIAKWSMRIFALVGTPLFMAIIAAVLLLIFNVLLGGEATFRQLFSATTHASIINFVGGMITWPLIRARQDVEITLALDLLVPGLSEGYLYRVLHGINFFSLWTGFVLGIAVSKIYPGRSAGSSAAIIIGVYVAIVAIFAVFGGGPGS